MSFLVFFIKYIRNRFVLAKKLMVLDGLPVVCGGLPSVFAEKIILNLFRFELVKSVGFYQLTGSKPLLLGSGFFL
jgi:hypothetical protein